MLRYMIISMAWLGACALLAGFGVNVPDKIFYPVLALIMIIAAVVFRAEG